MFKMIIKLIDYSIALTGLNLEIHKFMQVSWDMD